MAMGVLMSGSDVEKQTANNSNRVAVRSHHSEDEDAGKGLGFAMFTLSTIAFVSKFLDPTRFLSFICVIAAIVLSSILSCGCCCAGAYMMRPNARRFATATLVSLVFALVMQFFSIVAANAYWAGEEKTTRGYIGFFVVTVVLHSMSIVYSALFVWGREYSGCPF